MALRTHIRVFICCMGPCLAMFGLPAIAQTGVPSINSVSPSQGPIAGGTVVTITGSGFTPGTAVRFNRTAGTNVTVVDSSHLQVTTPPLGGGPFATALAAVRVSNAAGTTFGEFLYLPPRFDQIGIGDITTIAGVGNFVGEGRLGPQALVEAQATAVDAAGNLYMGEENGGRVRKIGPDGRIFTIAGTGVTGYSGDGGPATEAQFNWAAGVAVDRFGNVYVADFFGNHRVRKIDASTSIVRTIAGTGGAGYSGDGGPATQAQLNMPSSVALDSQGNVYVVDSGNQRVRRIDPSGSITTIAGNGATGFSGDGGPATQASFNLAGQLGTLTVDSRGNLYVVDFVNQRIRRIGSDGIVSTVAGGGALQPSEGVSATMVKAFFNCVAVDPQDRLLFTEGVRIWRVEQNGSLNRLAGNGTPGLSPDGVQALNAPMIPLEISVAPNGDIFASERSARRIRRIDAATGVLTTAAGIGPATIGDAQSPALAAVFQDIGNLALDGAGNILAVEPRGSLRIRKIDRAGKIATVAGIGVEPIRAFYSEGIQALGAGMAPVSVAAEANGRIVFTDFCSVRRIGTDGSVRTVVGPLTNNQQCGFAGDGGPGTGALLAAEQDVLKLDAQGNIFIADLFNHRVRKVDATTGIITTFAGSGPASVSGGYSGSPGGAFAGDGGPPTQALLSSPSDVAIDARRNVCIADTGNFTVRCVDSQGIIRTVAGRGSTYPGDGGIGTAAQLNPYRIAFDGAGNMYISDPGDGTIRKLDANGILSTVAGVHGRRGFSGDGGKAVQANIDYGSGLAVDAQGNILLFDGDNRRIRVIKQAATLGSAPAANYQGLWWNAPADSESGWGINFAHQDDIIFATWFTYDATGKAWWLSMTADKTTEGVYSGALYQTRGPAFNALPFDPAQVTRAPVGAGTLTFSSASSGTFAYTVNGIAQTKAIVQQQFGPLPTCVWGAQPDLTKATNFQDLWWAAPPGSESGWGVNLTQQGTTIFATWFTYDVNGNPLWYSVTAPPTGQNTFTGPLYRTTGPAFSAMPFDPGLVQRTAVGAATLTFANGDSGTLTYQVTDGANVAHQTKAITRQVFRAPGTVCQ